MREIVTARIGKGKAIHRYYPNSTRTDCATGGMGDADATIVEGAEITCKRCLKSLALEIEHLHGVALHEANRREEQEKLVEAGVQVDSRWVSVHQRDEVIKVTETSVSHWGTTVLYEVVAGDRVGYAASLPSFLFVRYYRKSAPTASVVYHQPSGDMYLVDGYDGEQVWLRDTAEWDLHPVSVTTLRWDYSARPATADVAVELSDLYVRRAGGVARPTYRVLGSELMESAQTLVWLEDTLTRTRHRITQDSLSIGYEAVCRNGNNHQVETCPGCGTEDENGNQVDEADPNADAYDARMLETQEGELRAPDAAAEPFMLRHLRVETADELDVLTAALEATLLGGVVDGGRLADAASSLLARLARTPVSRHLGAHPGWCGERVKEVYGGATARTRECRLALQPDGSCIGASQHV